MKNLVVCVGEKCHQSGAEIVLRSFKKIIARENLENKLCLKCCFAMGGCCEKDEVSVRLGDRMFRVDPKDAYLAFARDVWPSLNPVTED
jgi:hypothetical protein